MKSTLAILTLLALCACSAQPLTFDENGFPHGTGVKQYNYDAGPLMLEENYQSGKLVQSIWYRPDGTVIRQEEWENGSGTGIYLRQDGTIRAALPYVNGVAHGIGVDYDEMGHATNTVEYKRGQKISSQQWGPGYPPQGVGSPDP